MKMSQLQNEIDLAGLNYNVPKVEGKDELERKIDDLRMLGLSNLEELIQLILTNLELSKTVFINPLEQVEILSDLAKRLRKV